MSDKETGEQLPKQVVLYTDGGSKPSRGRGGYGVHGYVFTDEVPKQGAGAKALPTAEGYIDGGDKKKAVTIENYIDIWGSIEHITTNNEAELLAFIYALEYVLKTGVSKTVLLLDSSYVKNGLLEWIHGWVKNGWINSKGKPVENKDHWLRLLELKETVEKKGIELDLKWVRGHSGDLGNTRADELASRGVIMAQRHIVKHYAVENEAKGYWKPKADVNRMLAKSHWYFNTGIDNLQTPDGRYVYHMSSSDVMPGKPMSDVSFNVVYLAEPEPVLEKIRSFHDNLDSDIENRVVINYFSHTKRPDNYTDILEYDDEHHIFETKAHTVRLMNSKKEKICEEQRPARLAYRAIESLVSLEGLLDQYVTSDELVETDITDTLFDFEEKKGKTVCKLKKVFDVSTKDVTLDIHYDVGDSNGQIPINLLFDMDLPDRNTLSAIAPLCPRVKVITWKESDKAIRYGSVLDFGDKKTGDVGIWCSIYSNLRLLNQKGSKK